jgi:hypothetical protein
MNKRTFPGNPSIDVPIAPSEVKKEPFLGFIWNRKINRKYLWIILIGTLSQFFIFKNLYPSPDFFSDSYSYIYAAYANLEVSIWPIGYSKFLRWFHFITNSDTALIAFQYFLLQLSALYFFFTVQYFFKFEKSNRIALFIFLFFNPLFLYLSNYVNSDPLFAALSLFWFTHLIWIIYRPKIYQIFVHAVLLFLCFTIRNNAYYYPFVSIIAYALSKQKLWLKFTGIALPALLIVPFIIHTQNAAFRLTGTKQFSLFTGWQLANNALYIYEFADTAKKLTPQAQEVERLSQSFHGILEENFHSHILDYVGNYFIRESKSPLKQYVKKHFKIEDEYSNVVAWGKSSAVFSEYGLYIIKNNLRAYFHEFMVPNSKNYLFPPLEKLQIYNLGLDEVDPIAQEWFGWATNKVGSISKNVQGLILYIFPFLFAVLNMYLLGGLIVFWLHDKYKISSRSHNMILLLSFSFLLLNFIFCISATIIVFRYEFFPMIICFFSTSILSQLLEKKRPKMNTNSNRLIVDPATT